MKLENKSAEHHSSESQQYQFALRKENEFKNSNVVCDLQQDLNKKSMQIQSQLQRLLWEYHQAKISHIVTGCKLYVKFKESEDAYVSKKLELDLVNNIIHGIQTDYNIVDNTISEKLQLDIESLLRISVNSEEYELSHVIKKFIDTVKINKL